MLFKILWGILFAANMITLVAIKFAAFAPSPHDIAEAAFFSSAVACLAMVRSH